MSELELCPTCKKGKFRVTEEAISTRELVCGYCGQKRSMQVLMNRYSWFKLF
jgi:DNA-directed RNA polymerase subunit RPC12/RpoP